MFHREREWVKQKSKGEKKLHWWLSGSGISQIGPACDIPCTYVTTKLKPIADMHQWYIFRHQLLAQMLKTSVSWRLPGQISLRDRQCHALCTLGETSKCWLCFRPMFVCEVYTYEILFLCISCGKLLSSYFFPKVAIQDPIKGPFTPAIY